MVGRAKKKTLELPLFTKILNQTELEISEHHA